VWRVDVFLNKTKSGRRQAATQHDVDVVVLVEHRNYKQMAAAKRATWSVFCFLLISSTVSSWNSLSRRSGVKSMRTSSLTISSSNALDVSLDENGTNRHHGIKVLGVCGGIGSGKSAACKILVSELGCIAHIGKFCQTAS
jgi:hypothetical protein